MSSQGLLLHIKNFGFPKLLHQCFKREWEKKHHFQAFGVEAGKDKEEIDPSGKSMRWEIISPLLAVLPLLHLQIMWGEKGDPEDTGFPFLSSGYWTFLSLIQFYTNANLETTQTNFLLASQDQLKTVDLLTPFHMGILILQDQQCTALHGCSPHQTISWTLLGNSVPCAMVWHVPQCITEHAGAHKTPMKPECLLLS